MSWKLCLEFWLSLQHASAAELLFAVLVEEAEIAVGKWLLRRNISSRMSTPLIACVVKT